MNERRLGFFSHTKFFRIKSNDERPHEKLDMLVPTLIHQTSKVQWSDKVLPFHYDADMIIKKVTKNGSIRWGSYKS